MSKISNISIDRIGSRGSRTISCVILLFLAACSEPADTAKPEQSADLKQKATAAAVVAPENELQDEQPDESLTSLDDLLPEQFGALTAPWFGDLDGMAERRVIRVMVVSGGPQFFYYEGKPRGMIAELLVLLQKELNAE